MIEKGVNVNIKRNEENRALHCASSSGHIQVLEMLLDNGAEIDVRNEHGKWLIPLNIIGVTPLVAAVHNGQVK